MSSRPWIQASERARIIGLALISCAVMSGWVATPLALILGIVFGVIFENPLMDRTKTLSKKLLSASIVFLGAGVDLQVIYQVGVSGFYFTAFGIVWTLGLGYLLAKLFKVDRTVGQLTSVGTAICGGSAIAAVGPAMGASSSAMSVSLAVVFLLNAAGLFLFPWIGHSLHLSEAQFGLWSALAIHDTSSVVGAGVAYGAEALRVGTNVKLSRALWILVVTPLIAWWEHRGHERSGQSVKIPFPGFILGYVLVSAAFSFFPDSVFPDQLAALKNLLVLIGRYGLTLSIFLIGTLIQTETLKKTGVPALAHGVVLWVLVAGSTLILIQQGVIHL